MHRIKSLKVIKENFKPKLIFYPSHQTQSHPNPLFDSIRLTNGNVDLHVQTIVEFHKQHIATVANVVTDSQQGQAQMQKFALERNSVNMSWRS